MLSFSARLKKKDFDNLKGKKSSVFCSDFLSLRIFESDDKNSLRFAVVVPSAVSKKAVDRNKIKRRIKSIFVVEINKIKKGRDMVFYVKKGVSERGFKDIKIAVLKLFTKAKILND